MNAPRESTNQLGGRESDDDVVKLLKRTHVPVTRENYLQLAYFGEPPEPWTREHEAELPPHLQDWDQFT
jgi:hypothetical protein